MVKAALAAFAALLVAAALYGLPRSYSGIYTSSFEHSEFDGCWVNFSRKASARLVELHPRVFGPEGSRYQVEFVGRSTHRLKDVKPGQGYGHVGAYPCEIEVLELRSARRLPPAAR